MQEIFDTYYEKIYYWSLKKTKNIDDAHDLANNIFLSIFQYINKNIEIEKLDNLIWKIATNLWNKRAKEYIDEKNNVELYENTLEDNQDFIDKIIYRDIVDNLDNYNLTDKEKICFKYYYFEDLSIKEIIEKMNSSESNIKYYLYSARNKIKERYYD